LADGTQKVVMFVAGISAHAGILWGWGAIAMAVGQGRRRRLGRMHFIS
jgi:hypothetical protein